MKIGERIKEKRSRLELTLEEVAAKIGVSRQTLSRYENSIITNIPSDKIEALAEALRTTPAYLMGWEARPTSQDPINSFPVGRVSKIPVIGSVFAGVGGIAQGEFLGYDFATDITNEGEYKYLVVKGDSMLPDIHEGDLALIHIQEDIESGELAVVIVNGEEGLIKKVFKRDGAIVLKSFNPYYPDRIFSGAEMNAIRIWGRVKEIKRTY